MKTREQRLDDLLVALEREFVENIYPTKLRPKMLSWLQGISILDKAPSPRQLFDVFGTKLVELPKEAVEGLLIMFHNISMREKFDQLLDEYDRSGIDGVKIVLGQSLPQSQVH